jgi:hypothetical protein
MARLGYGVVLMAILAISVLTALPIRLIPSGWLTFLDVLPIKLLLSLLFLVLTASLLHEIYTYWSMTKSQRMLSGIFRLLITLFPILCLAPYGKFQFDSASGEVAGEIRNGADPKRPLVAVKATGGFKSGGIDPTNQMIQIVVIMLAGLFLSTFLYMQTEQQSRPKHPVLKRRS